jgi:hypothetical protein
VLSHAVVYVRELVSFSELADLFDQVDLAKLSNLRARDPQFPQPASVQGRAYLYAREDITAYAQKYGWREAAQPEPNTSPSSEFPNLEVAVIALLAITKAVSPTPITDINSRQAIHDFLSPGSPWAPLVRQAGIASILTRALGSHELESLLRNLAPLAATQLSKLMNSRIDATSLDQAGRILPTATSTALTSWVMAAAGQVPVIVADPACGFGTILTAASASKNPLTVIGADTEELSVRMSALRLLGQGQRATLFHTDALDPTGPLLAYNDTIELVLLDAPSGMNKDWSKTRTQFGQPPVNEQVFQWIALAHRLLTDGGRGIVITPRKILDSAARAATFRQALMRAGAIEAIITLPKGMRTGSAPDLAMWVITKNAHNQMRPILTVNGSTLEDTHPDGAAPLILQQFLEQFRNRINPSHDINSTAFRIINTEDQQGESTDLNPWSDISQPLLTSSLQSTTGFNERSRVLETITRVQQQLAALSDSLFERQNDPNRRSDTANLNELVRSGHIIVYELEPNPHPYPSPRSFQITAWSQGSAVESLEARYRAQTTYCKRKDVIIEPNPKDTSPHLLAHEYPSEYDEPSYMDSPQPSSIYLLRIRKGESWLRPQTLVHAINTLAATNWPKGSRGPLDLQRAAPLIEFPVERSAQATLEIATTLNESLAGLSNEIRNPKIWT